MSYTALYRKFRPTTFSEMVGQEHITRTLKNQIIANRVGHAYLFNGSRGTGKTSAAKIMARAINCLNPVDGEPCNECEICKSILSGSLSDVVEMDAASNNSVEDIRAIREEVKFLPTVAKYRVYIIDEVHMLSTGAFNALLKTLEEPPEHVKFILATTEPQKLPATILSRCQRFDFKRISVENIMNRLEKICKEANVNIEKEALKLIAILSEGALRDAISILERCMQEEGTITEDKVRELVGIPKLEYINRITEALFKKDSNNIIKITDYVINEGKDLDNFLWEIIKYIKDILVYKTTKTLQLYNKEEQMQISKLSEEIEKEQILELLYNLSELGNLMKWTNQKNIIFQTGLLKECMQKKQNKNQEISYENQTINNMQKQVKEHSNIKPEIKNINKNAIKQNSEVSKGYLPYWNNVINKVKQSGKMMIYTNLIGTNAIQINDMTIGIEFKSGITPFAKQLLEDYENKTFLSKIISEEAGNVMQIKLIEKGESNFQTKTQKNSIEDLGIPINIIEE